MPLYQHFRVWCAQKKMRLPDFLVIPGKFQEILKESVDSGEGKKRVEAMEAEEKKLNWYNIQAETTLTVGVKLWLWGVSHA